MKLKYILPLNICLFLLHLYGFSQDQTRSGGILKPEQANMDIRHYTVQLQVDPTSKSIQGTTTIKLNVLGAGSRLIFDLSDSLPATRVWVNGRAQPFTHRRNLVDIPLPLTAGAYEVKIRYGGKPVIATRPPWNGGFTWATDSTGNPWVAISCQLEGAKIYFPCKDHPSDEPNEGAELQISVPKGLTVAGPGLLISKTTRGNWTTFHWRTRYTINNYSILFNIGKFRVVERTYTTIAGTKVPLQFYVLEEHAQYANHHLDIFERTIALQEKYFGEYPWAKEKIAICETPHLGMEHQTMNAYGNKFHYSKVGGEDFDWLMHHEFGHEWWGNKITCNDWADMWIHEGICSFGDALYTLDHEGRAAYIERMRRTGMHTANKVPVVQGKNLDTDSVYTGDIYGKGAFFMHTLQYVLGDSVFFPALRGFATDERFTYDNKVSTADVMNYFSKASGKNLKPLFDLYIYSTEKLDISIHQKDTDLYSIRLVNFDMPLPMQIMYNGENHTIVLDKKGLDFKSATLPQVDPEGWYLKRLLID